MSCSGNGKSVAGGAWVIAEDNYSSPTFKQPNECDEGYLARAGNPEGNLEGGAPEKDKILNVSIPVGVDLSVNVQMEMTPGSKKVAKWENGTSIPGLSFDIVTGKFSGTVSLEGRYATTIKAYDSSGAVIDSKSYLLVASKASADDFVKFIHPMPGSVITSRCTASVDGTQVWKDPKRGRPHKGIDLAYPGGKIGNVRAAASGEVLRAVSDGSSKGYGNVVYIGHTNASGKRVCITVYGHLSSVAVKVGQKVSAGDFIGVEGNTGISHGAHLHFEIRSPEFASGVVSAACYDPAAYISGEVSFDDTTSRSDLDAGRDSDPSKISQSNIRTKNNGNAVALTSATADNKCSGYQPAQDPPYTIEEPKTGECWKDAYAFVMKEEVGPWFNPNDLETQQGLISTSAQRKKVGYVTDTGGETKFGVAKKFNQSLDITALTLSQAEAVYKDKYWTANNCQELPSPLCGLYFNACVNPGPGAAPKMLMKALGASSKAEAFSKAKSMSAADLKSAGERFINEMRNYYENLCNGNPSKFGKYRTGWLNRCDKAKYLVA